MEDAHATQLSILGDPRAALFGVFDGHNGANVAKYCGLHLSDHFHSCAPELLEKGEYADVMGRTFLDIDSTLRNNPEHEEGGCTAVSVLLINKQLYCAGAGDARAIIMRHDGTVEALSDDHKPTRASEIERVKAAGGTVENGRVNGMLAVTRAIGDFGCKRDDSRSLEDQVITAKADVTVTSALGTKGTDATAPSRTRYIIIACDGIWDVLTNEQAAEFIARQMKERAGDVGLVCEDLLDHCCADAAPGVGTDNMTVIIVELLDPLW